MSYGIWLLNKENANVAADLDRWS